MSKPTAFPLDESRLPFEIPRDEPYREKIARLGQMITDRIPAKKGILTKDDPEYWGLASIVTDEMADVALKMKVRKPMTLPELVKATGKPAGELEPLLQQMAVVGLLEYNWENPRREKQYILPMFVPGSAEFFNMNKQQIADHPEVTAFFERMTFLPLEHITAMVPPGGAGIGMHVIPVEKAIETENRSADIEHISHWLKKYDGKYAAGPCSCRMSRAAMGEGCGDDPDDWCIGVGDMADYLVETNKGHYVTYDEVMQILQKAEDNGFVHQITNIDGENKIFAICNCNVNVCNALRTSQLFNTPNMSRSAYVARVEPENCVACGRCVEYCPAGAVKLGQKLCTKDGPITYPKQELPDAVKWGPDKWAIDYRDKNRVNCYDTGTAPCKTACPAHIAVQGYLKMAAQGRYRDALALIKKENPFPAVCGRVCNRRCEDTCTRGTVDQAVAIDAVKKFIAEQDLNAAHRYVPDVVQPSLQGPWPQKIAIIGGGPAGMGAALAAHEAGASTVVIERNEHLGGILRQCIHPGFGLTHFKEELTGPEYAQRFINRVREAGIDVMLGSMALGINEGGREDAAHSVTVMGEDGMVRLTCRSVVLAMGCRERTRFEIKIPGSRPAGVYTAGLAQRYINIENLRPGHRVVILGSGDIGLIMARRCALEGLEVEGVYELMPYANGLHRNVKNCLEDFGIPLHLSTTVTRVIGRDRVEAVEVSNVGEDLSPIPGTERIIPCDTLLLSVGLIPENELARAAEVEIDPRTRGARVDQDLQTNVDGIFSCGNVLQVHDLAANVTAEATSAGAAAAAHALGTTRPDVLSEAVTLEPGGMASYIVPARINRTVATKAFFRVRRPLEHAQLVIRAGDAVLFHGKTRDYKPSIMEAAPITPKMLAAVKPGETLTVSIDPVEEA